MKDENIEVGEYIRTMTGEIRIVKSINEDGSIVAENMLFSKNVFLTGDIKKHSQSINNLVEEGDIVNDELVYGLWWKGHRKQVLYIGYTDIKKITIETILTREKYNQNCCFVEKWKNLERTKKN